MKQKLLNSLIIMILVTMVFAPITHGASALSSHPSEDAYVYSGSIRCGTLKDSWSNNLRRTENIYLVPRTVYFEPERIGTHQIRFFLDGGYDAIMTPYWSNDGGKTWKSWKWSPGYIRAGDDPKTLSLRTDSTKTIYKFVFYTSTLPRNAEKASYAYYRFYCD